MNYNGKTKKELIAIIKEMQEDEQYKQLGEHVSERRYREDLNNNEELNSIIEELKNEKLKAEESKQQLELVANNFVNGMLYQVVTHDETSRKFTYLSNAVEKLYGCSASEAMQNPDIIYSKIHPEDIGDIIEKEKEAVNEMRIFKAEARVINPDGSIRWSYYISRPRKINNFLYWDGIEIDISERKKLEFELTKAKEQAEESESQFRNLFDKAADAIFIADVETKKIVDLNQAAEHLMQLTKKEIIGLHQSKLHPPQTEEYARTTFQQHQQATADNDSVHLIENTIIRPDGSELPVEILASKIIYKGKICLMGTFRDISERKKAEIEVLEAKEAAEAINANITAILEGTDDSIWAFDRNYEILYINNTFQKEFLDTFGVLLEPGVNLVNSLPEPLRPIWKPRYDRVLANEQFSIEDEVNVGNNKIFIEIRFNPILKKGKVIGGSCFGSNITSRKLAEIELVKAKEKAEESDRLKTAFLQNMSHEIRTPMNGIMGFADLLEDCYNDKEKLERYSKIIFQRGSDLLEIIDDILDISRIESGKLPLEYDECDLNQLFTELSSFYKQYQKRLNKENLKLNFHKPVKNTKSLIKTDIGKLKQILNNLISNAIKFTEEGTIDCGYELDKDQLIFYVSDTGIGIPEDKQDSIFERFYQLNDPRIKGNSGTGLGLPIAKGLVELLGGKIWLESDCQASSTSKPAGTCFRFTIKYAEPDTQPKTMTEGSDKETAQFSDKTILIVEDDEYNTLYLKEVLAKYGPELLLAKNSEEAIHAATSQKVDLVLMDICLPDLNGYETTQIIKKNKSGIDIIAQTAYAGEGERQRAFEAGCIDYISKPIIKDKLIKMISRYLQRKVQ